MHTASLLSVSMTSAYHPAPVPVHGSGRVALHLLALTSCFCMLLLHSRLRSCVFAAFVSQAMRSCQSACVRRVQATVTPASGLPVNPVHQLLCRAAAAAMPRVRSASCRARWGSGRGCGCQALRLLLAGWWVAAGVHHPCAQRPT